MRKNWIGTVVLVSVSIFAGLVFSQTREQALGQPVGSFAVPPQVNPQVVLQQQPELPKWCVHFVTLPPLQGEHLPRIQVITVVDTEAKKIAVYHLDISTGGLKLLSVRDIQPDLMLDQFNATSPLPSEITREMQRLDEKK